jgi:hypothetical protein
MMKNIMMQILDSIASMNYEECWRVKFDGYALCLVMSIFLLLSSCNELSCPMVFAALRSDVLHTLGRRPTVLQQKECCVRGLSTLDSQI